MTTRRKERDISQSIALTHRVADKVPAMSSILGVNQRECLNPSSSSKKKFDHHVVFEHNLEKVQNVVHQLFRTDKEENLHLKAGFGVLAGIFGGGILYLMLYFLYKIPALVCLYIVLPCTIILCLGMALSTGFRCVVMISLPTLSTGRGRTAIYSLIFALLLTGPVANISANLHLISATMSCSADLARNQTAALKQQLQDPINTIKNKMEGVASTLSSVGDTLSTAFSPIYSGIEAAAAGLGAAAGRLNEASYACNSMFTGAYTDCYNGINSAYTECKNTLDDIPVIGKRDLTRVKERILRHKKFIAALEKVKEEYIKIREKLGKKKALEMMETLDMDFSHDVNNLLKDILSNFTSDPGHRSKRGLSDVCNALNVGSICDVLKVSSGICDPVEAADTLVTEAATKTNEAYQAVKDWFNVKVYKNLGIEGLVNASKTAAQIQQQIQEQLTADTSLVVDNLAILGNLLALLLLFLMIQSALYLRSYISRDEYDNVYITKQFREYDEECRNIKKRTVLPLKKAEKKMYIDCSSCLLTAVEFKASFTGLAQLFLHMIVCVILVFFDYVFYYVVYLVQRYGNIEIDLAGSSSIVLTVEGTGEIAQLLRALISDINIQNTYNADLNFTTCLPVALLPETSNIVLYITLYLIAFGTIIIQAYGMRTRRRISAYFYPRQETERIMYLHKKIIFKRQGRQKFQFMHMKTRKKERDTSQSLALTRKVANKVPAMTSILQVNQRECLSCGDKEKEDSVFYTCSNVDCYADYCDECYQDMNEKCVLCNPPQVSYEKQDWQME